MIKLVAITGVRWQGQRYRPGAVLEVPDDIAARLLEIGSARRPRDGSVTAPAVTLEVEPEPTYSREAMVRDAVTLLDPANDEHWTKTGRPRVEVVEAILRFDISRDELDAFHRPEGDA